MNAEQQQLEQRRGYEGVKRVEITKAEKKKKAREACECRNQY